MHNKTVSYADFRRNIKTIIFNEDACKSAELATAGFKFLHVIGQAPLWATYFGSGNSCGESLYDFNVAIGRYTAEHSIGAITGASIGVMEAPLKGVLSAGKSSFFGFGIRLRGQPDGNPTLSANPEHYYSFPNDTLLNLFYRELLLVSWADAFIVNSGGIGTEFEHSLVQTLEKTSINAVRPVIYASPEKTNSLKLGGKVIQPYLAAGLLPEEELPAIRILHTPAEISNSITSFYSNFIVAYPNEDTITLFFKKDFPADILAAACDKYKINALRVDFPKKITPYVEELVCLSIPRTTKSWKQQQLITFINENTTSPSRQ